MGIFGIFRIFGIFAAHIARTENSENPHFWLQKNFLKFDFHTKNYCIFEEISSRAIPSTSRNFPVPWDSKFSSQVTDKSENQRFSMIHKKNTPFRHIKKKSKLYIVCGEIQGFLPNGICVGHARRYHSVFWNRVQKEVRRFRWVRKDWTESWVPEICDTFSEKVRSKNQ